MTSGGTHWSTQEYRWQVSPPGPALLSCVQAVHLHHHDRRRRLSSRVTRRWRRRVGWRARGPGLTRDGRCMHCNNCRCCRRKLRRPAAGQILASHEGFLRVCVCACLFMRACADHLDVGQLLGYVVVGHDVGDGGAGVLLWLERLGAVERDWVAVDEVRVVAPRRDGERKVVIDLQTRRASVGFRTLEASAECRHACAIKREGRRRPGWGELSPGPM